MLYLTYIKGLRNLMYVNVFAWEVFLWTCTVLKLNILRFY